MNIDKDAFEYAISQIDDGFVFENFAVSFLSSVLEHGFIPVGGTKDKGIDGYQHTFSRQGNDKIIYQLSTEKTFEDKIHNTIEKLIANKIEFDRIYYVTNRKLNGTDTIIEKLYDKFQIPITIFDIKWFVSNSNYNQTTIRSYQSYVDTYLHEFTKPGKSQVVANLDNDSRLYVFLSQQFDSRTEDFKLDDLLADTLILFALEGTDPDKEILLSQEEVKEAIKKYIKFDPQLLDKKLSERLIALSTKPRKIKYHTEKQGYCLPYETRLEIGERNIKDEILLTTFLQQTKGLIQKYFLDLEVNVKDIQQLITNVFNKIYEKQGLEFSNFVLNGDNKTIIEQDLAGVIGNVVDNSPVVLRNKEKVKTAIHLSIREIVYNGTPEQHRFLQSLSNTYLMMFMLQWEPKISTYFETLASNLNVFVDNSIIVPALSEYYLEDGNKRHWNLLEGASKAGISLYINESLLDELASHFSKIRNIYYRDFSDNEVFYLDDEYELLFIDEVLIRAYFYAKKRELVSNFDDFLNNFIDPNLKQVKEELIIYLKEIFGIIYISNEAWDIKIDEDEKNKLADKLEEKKIRRTAESDAEMILSIYYLRNKNNESSDSGIFGYKTWWLSKDTSTYWAVEEALGKKYPISCYIRPDFVYNYIALKPGIKEVNDAYKEIFPTMLGVNLSYHMPKEVSSVVKQKIKEFHDKPEVRVKQILKNLGEKLKSDPSLRNRHSVELFLDSEMKKISGIE
jgi:hypothetical protein